MTLATPPTPRMLRGGEWLIQTVDPPDVFTPEQMSDEHHLIARTVADFASTQVLTVLDQLEGGDWAAARRLLRRCGELGLTGVDVPHEDGGEGLDTVASMIVSERMSASASFGATFGAQVNLTILPLSLFGTAEQKRKYLPRLMAGDLVGAYCLSEPGAGSDALGARTRAARQADGSFLLNGEKTWITNGGFADLFIVFAKVDGEHFTAFIVERAFPGVSSGKEEHKMGLHGSSTTPVVLQDVSVPANNVLGEIGRGHKVAFNVLNFARFKLGATCAGGARGAIGEAARYAGQRKQFGQPIASFGAIRHKLGEMVARAYAIESLTYRTAGMIDARMAATPHDPIDRSAALAAFEEYAVEASIAKVAGSEMLDFVLDENIQIHGGNGFVRDYPAERHYRDARVNRIFEGTNEINRLLISSMLARRAANGEPALLSASGRLRNELSAPLSPPPFDDAVTLAGERCLVEGMKKGTLLVFGLAVQTFGRKLADEQEVLMQTSDMLIDVYAAESAILRACAAVATETPRTMFHVDAARVFINDAAMRLEVAARQVLPVIVQGDPLETMRSALDRLPRVKPIDTVTMRRRLADETVTRGGYVF